jgi:hypothetical protein
MKDWEKNDTFAKKTDLRICALAFLTSGFVEFQPAHLNLHFLLFFGGLK